MEGAESCKTLTKGAGLGKVVRENLPSGNAALRLNVDATRKGNVARFFNHRCSLPCAADLSLDILARGEKRKLLKEVAYCCFEQWEERYSDVWHCGRGMGSQSCIRSAPLVSKQVDVAMHSTDMS